MSNLVEFTHTQGGMNNVKAMLQIITQKYLLDNPRGNKDALSTIESLPVPRLEVTPDIGLLHPLLVNEDGSRKYALNPKECKYTNCYSCSIQYYRLSHLWISVSPSTNPRPPLETIISMRRTCPTAKIRTSTSRCTTHRHSPLP
jgi:hypothetical protein